MAMKSTSLFLFSLAICVSAATAAPPNVVVFLADDAGWGDYSFSGNEQISTPNIDSIAERGVSLDRFFCEFGLLADSRGVFDRALSSAPRLP